jgi:hypothetical protein
MNKNDFYARTMHTPDTPERAELRAALRDLSKALIPLHRQLIDAAKVDYGQAFEPVEKPAEMLRLLTVDPFFEWLQPMTRLIVDIDEMARVDFTDEDAFAIGDRVERFFGGTPDPAFAEKYVPILQREFEVTIGHAAVRKALSRLRRPNVG